MVLVRYQERKGGKEKRINILFNMNINDILNGEICADAINFGSFDGSLQFADNEGYDGDDECNDECSIADATLLLGLSQTDSAPAPSNSKPKQKRRMINHLKLKPEDIIDITAFLSNESNAESLLPKKNRGRRKILYPKMLKSRDVKKDVGNKVYLRGEKIRGQNGEYYWICMSCDNVFTRKGAQKHGDSLTVSS